MKWLIKKFFYTTYLQIQKDGVDEFIKYIIRKPRHDHTYIDDYGNSFTIDVQKTIKESE